MRLLFRGALLLAAVLACALQPWSWKDEAGTTHSRPELDSILQAHVNWLDRPKPTNSLIDDQAGKANLGEADLSGAYLSNARLTRASLFKANLTSAVLSFADLKGAELGEAKLIGAYLNWANLEYADLGGADLTGSHLVGAVLTGTNLFGANLTDATYVPKTSPDAEGIAHARGLGYLRWDSDSRPIFALRKALGDGGFKDAAKQVSAAIRRHGQTNVERFFFDWTCEWGANALRPLELISALCVICSLVYWTGLEFGNRSCLYLVATGQRIRTTGGKERALPITKHASASLALSGQLELDLPPSVSRAPELRSSRHRFRASIKRLSTALLFSMMSVFNIGFREANFGAWIRMVQPREFDLRARGWMRTVSGIQSILGLALLALSLLSYFSHPFE